MRKVIVEMQDGSKEIFTDYEYERVHVEYKFNFVVIHEIKHDEFKNEEIYLTTTIPSSAVLSIKTES